MTRRFPDGFRWGTATSSYQIEGAAADDGRTPSIWDTFSRVPGAVLDGSTGDVACDHYHRYVDDVALLSQLGVQDYRFSISWSRVLPHGGGEVNEAGLDFYSRLVDELLNHDISPLVTLYHWDLPQELEDAGGWPQRDIAQRFADYASVVAGRLGDRVQAFTTLNEPWCSSFLGYAAGVHAPGRRENAAAYASAHHLLLAHGLAVEALRAELPGDRQLSITLNPSYVVPVSEEPADRAQARFAELASNQVFLDPLLRGEVNAELVELTASITDWSFVQDADLATISRPLDFVGVNYYKPQLVGAEPDAEPDQWPGVPTAFEHAAAPPITGMGWRVEPATMTALLVDLDRAYPDTVFVVTENGSAFPDELDANGRVEDTDRANYLAAHVAAVADAIDAGVDVRGYFAWSLLDNYEWAWGYTQRFGIVHVDFDTQQRTVKASGEHYRDLIAAHGVPDDTAP